MIKYRRCPFASGANQGECTGEAGILSNAEIGRIMADKNLKPEFDKTAGVKWITWDSDQWVSYDDADTFKLKMDFANKLGLAGMSTFVSVYQPMKRIRLTARSGLGTGSR